MHIYIHIQHTYILARGIFPVVLWSPWEMRLIVELEKSGYRYRIRFFQLSSCTVLYYTILYNIVPGRAGIEVYIFRPNMPTQNSSVLGPSLGAHTQDRKHTHSTYTPASTGYNWLCRSIRPVRSMRVRSVSCGTWSDISFGSHWLACLPNHVKRPGQGQARSPHDNYRPGSVVQRIYFFFFFFVVQTDDAGCFV